MAKGLSQPIKKKKGGQAQCSRCSYSGHCTPRPWAHINPLLPRAFGWVWKSWDEDQEEMAAAPYVYVGPVFHTDYPTRLCYHLGGKEARIFILIWQIRRQNPRSCMYSAVGLEPAMCKLGGSEQPRPPERRQWDKSGGHRANRSWGNSLEGINKEKSSRGFFCFVLLLLLDFFVFFYVYFDLFVCLLAFTYYVSLKLILCICKYNAQTTIENKMSQRIQMSI